MGKPQDLNAIAASFAEIGSRMGLSAMQAGERLAAFQRITRRHQKKQWRGLKYGYRRLRALRHGLPKCKCAKWSFRPTALFT